MTREIKGKGWFYIIITTILLIIMCSSCVAYREQPVIYETVPANRVVVYPVHYYQTPHYHYYHMKHYHKPPVHKKHYPTKQHRH